MVEWPHHHRPPRQPSSSRCANVPLVGSDSRILPVFFVVSPLLGGSETSSGHVSCGLPSQATSTHCYPRQTQLGLHRQLPLLETVGFGMFLELGLQHVDLFFGESRSCGDLVGVLPFVTDHGYGAKFEVVRIAILGVEWLRQVA